MQRWLTFHLLKNAKRIWNSSIAYWKFNVFFIVFNDGIVRFISSILNKFSNRLYQRRVKLVKWIWKKQIKTKEAIEMCIVTNSDRVVSSTAQSKRYNNIHTQWNIIQRVHGLNWHRMLTLWFINILKCLYNVVIMTPDAYN